MRKQRSTTLLSLILVFAASAAVAQPIIQIIDATGDGTNALDQPLGIAVDGSANVYVAGNISTNAFKVTAAGVITEIIDATGDGINTFGRPFGIAVDTSGNVYTAARFSDNAFNCRR